MNAGRTTARPDELPTDEELGAATRVLLRMLSAFVSGEHEQANAAPVPVQLVDRRGLLAALAIGGEALRALERRGVVPHVMVGARRRYDVAAVVAALAAAPARKERPDLGVVRVTRRGETRLTVASERLADRYSTAADEVHVEPRGARR